MLLYLFRVVLAMSAAASAAWLLLKLVLWLIKGRISASMAYYLRLTVLFFLLVPLWFLPLKQAPFPAKSPVGNPGVSSQSPAAAEENVAKAEKSEGSPFSPVDFSLLGGIWLTGAALFLSGAFLRRRGCFALLRRDSSPCTDPETLRILQETAGELSLKKYPSAVLNRRTGSPMLAGLCRPVIFLPDTKTQESQLRLVLRHELLHYQRKDLWVKLFVLLAAAIHWFNPIVWVFIHEINLACELSCDEGVAAELSTEGRREYGRAILSALSETQKKQNMLFAPFGSGQQNMKRRLCAIMERNPNRKHAGPAAGVLTAIIFIAGLFAGCSIAPETPAGEDSSSSASVVSTIFSPQEIADEFIRSVSYDRISEKLAVTTPAGLPEDTNMSLHISGRQSMGENGAMSLHLFEEESESESWKMAKTYEATVRADTLLEFDIQFTLMEKDTGEILAAASTVIKGDVESDTSSLSSDEDELLNPVSDSNAFINPLDGDSLTPIAKFGQNGHRGIDFKAEEGTPVYAVHKGTVLLAGQNGSFGNMVEIDHGDGLHSIYAHCSAISVKKGETVEQGRQIATVGNTGNSTGYHLHLEMMKNGTAIDPLSKIPGNQPVSSDK